MSWFLSFSFVNAGWGLLRARTLAALTGMCGMNGVVLPRESFTRFLWTQGVGVEFGLSLRNIEGDIRTPLMIVFLLVSPSIQEL